MAFEEAGKGFSHELNAKSNKALKINSKHQNRHLMCALILMTSLNRKYNFTHIALSKDQLEDIRKRLEAAKSFSEFAKNPASNEERQIVGEEIYRQIDALPQDRRIVAHVEMNWLKKIAKSSMLGDVERLRQKGFYVDFDDNGMLSKPSEISRNDAFKWIWSAKRAVNLLAFGIYFQPYSELADMLEQMSKPLPSAEKILSSIIEMYQCQKHEKDEGPGAVSEDMVPYEPFRNFPDPPNGG